MKRFKALQTYLLCIFIMGVFLMTGCGGGGGGTEHWEGAPAPGAGAGAGATTIIPGAVCTVAAGPAIPTVVSSNPTSGNLNVTTSTTGVAGGGKLITATFSLAMNAATIDATSFTLAPVGGAVLVPASVGYNASTKVATLTTSSALVDNTSYTVTITTAVTSAGGIPISCGYAWDFKTITPPAAGVSAINLGLASTYGIASAAGLTSTGVTVVVNGNVALWPLGTCTDATGAPANCAVESKPPSALGLTVNGLIRFPTDSDAGATALAVMTDLTAAYNEGMAKVNTEPAIAANQLGGPGPAGKIYFPGVYENANLGFAAGTVATMDAQNDADAIFIFKVTLGGDFVDSGTLLLPTEIKLANGAQAKNIWFVIGRDITIGSGTIWNGNILADRTATVNDGSTVNGRVLAGAGGAGAVTLTGAAAPSVTTINVPLP